MKLKLRFFWQQNMQPWSKLNWYVQCSPHPRMAFKLSNVLCSNLISIKDCLYDYLKLINGLFDYIFYSILINFAIKIYKIGAISFFKVPILIKIKIRPMPFLSRFWFRRPISLKTNLLACEILFYGLVPVRSCV